MSKGNTNNTRNKDIEYLLYDIDIGDISWYWYQQKINMLRTRSYKLLSTCIRVHIYIIYLFILYYFSFKLKNMVLWTVVAKLCEKKKFKKKLYNM